MPNTETEFDRATQQKMIFDILNKFYIATGVPIALIDDKLVMTGAVPNQELFPCRMILPYLNKCQENLEALEAKDDGRHLIILPIKDSRGIFGYVCAIFAFDHPAGYSESIRKFAEYVVEDITTNCLTILFYQKYVDYFKLFIWEYLDTDLSVNTLCKLMGVGKTTLSARFKKYAGTSAAKFILETRMEKAQVLLTTTDMSVVEVSAKVGFNDYNYFCRVFRRKVGSAPSNYRMQHRV